VTRDRYESQEDWGAHTSTSAPGSKLWSVLITTPSSTGIAAWPQGVVQLPLWPLPAKYPRVTSEQQAPVTSESHMASSFAYAAPTSSPTALAPAAPTMTPAGSSNIVPLSSAMPAAPPQTLTGAFCVDTGRFQALWWVDARKLRGNDKQAVSPPFEMSSEAPIPGVKFKMMIYPKVMSDQKGGASFKKANGRGFVQLKCEAELSEATATFSFRISIGMGENKQAFRGPKIHNFLKGAVCGLDKHEEEWDFQTVVDPETMTFVVCLEIVPLADVDMRQT